MSYACRRGHTRVCVCSKPCVCVVRHISHLHTPFVSPQKDDKDWLFAMTSRYHVAVLAYEQGTGDMLTKAYGNVKVGVEGRVGVEGMVYVEGMVFICGGEVFVEGMVFICGGEGGCGEEGVWSEI